MTNELIDNRKPVKLGFNLIRELKIGIICDYVVERIPFYRCPAYIFYQFHQLFGAHARMLFFCPCHRINFSGIIKRTVNVINPKIEGTIALLSG